MRGTHRHRRAGRTPFGIIPAYAGNTVYSSCQSLLSRDHPRVCGEHPMQELVHQSAAGSSPRMRGTPRPVDLCVPAAGIIPAYAGNTQVCGMRSLRRGDHPRVCGEHICLLTRFNAASGSSPRMRGTHAASCARMSAMGIIPAYAGNTPSTIGRRSCTWDHPRVCGEHHVFALPCVLVSGSSPRMRGTPFRAFLMAAAAGIIPAYAGNTCRPRRPWTWDWDHPRVCGEHLFSGLCLAFRLGSSPRMRGTRSYDPRRVCRPGIIPAYAGNTYARSIVTVIFRDHPRVCGEHNMRRAGLAVNQGSSPRMRGTLRFHEDGSASLGIIPAYAGNTCTMFLNLPLLRDHPRVCGEHLCPNCLCTALTGSSPRMRGTLERSDAFLGDDGIIPAYAGNTRPGLPAGRAKRDHPRVCGEHTKRL